MKPTSKSQCRRLAIQTDVPVEFLTLCDGCGRPVDSRTCTEGACPTCFAATERAQAEQDESDGFEVVCDNCGRGTSQVTAEDCGGFIYCRPCLRAALAQGHAQGLHDPEGETVDDCPGCEARQQADAERTRRGA